MKIGIAGAGIMGRMLAFMLSNAGYTVTLFDNDSDNSCSMTAAGLLTPATEMDKAEKIIYTLGKKSIENFWPEIIKKLSTDIYFKRTGTIVLAHPMDETLLTQFTEKINTTLANKNYCKKINIAEIEPDIQKFQNTYYFADEAQIDSQAVMQAFADNMQNITWHKNTIVKRTSNGKIITKDNTHTFDTVVDCRGMGAKEHFHDLRGVRGELIWLQAPDVRISRPIRFLHPRYSIYIVPRPNNIYIIGASEIEAEDNSAISVRTTLELLTAVYYLHPAFAEARIIKTAVNQRPALASHLPKIKYSERFVAINGLYRHGYLLAPALANDVLNWLEAGVTAVNHLETWEKYND